MTADEIDQKRGLLQRHKQILLAPSSDLAYKVMLWCIFHVPILKDEAVLQRTILVLYEDLLLNPAAETNRIIRQLNLNEDHFDAATVNFRKASKTNFNASLEAAPLKQLEKGIKQLNETELNEIQQILDYFSVKLYTASSPVPNKAFLPGSLHGGVIPGQ